MERGVKMRKMRFLVCMVAAMSIFIGCSKIGDNATKLNIEETNKYSEEDFNKEDIEQLVMVNGELYYNTEKESTMATKCGVMDGKITSMVNQDEIPKENEQSNFGKGYGYKRGARDGQIELNIDSKWIVFESLENETNFIESN